MNSCLSSSIKNMNNTTRTQADLKKYKNLNFELIYGSLGRVMLLENQDKAKQNQKDKFNIGLVINRELIKNEVVKRAIDNEITWLRLNLHYCLNLNEIIMTDNSLIMILEAFNCNFKEFISKFSPSINAIINGVGFLKDTNNAENSENSLSSSTKIANVLILLQAISDIIYRIVLIVKDIKQTSLRNEQLLFDSNNINWNNFLLKLNINSLFIRENNIVKTKFSRNSDNDGFIDKINIQLNENIKLISKSISIKFIDFNFSKDVLKTKLKPILGNSLTISPERLLEKHSKKINENNLDSLEKDLIWSIGVMIYQIIFNKNPFGKTNIEILSNLKNSLESKTLLLSNYNSEMKEIISPIVDINKQYLNSNDINNGLQLITVLIDNVLDKSIIKSKIACINNLKEYVFILNEILKGCLEVNPLKRLDFNSLCKLTNKLVVILGGNQNNSFNISNKSNFELKKHSAPNTNNKNEEKDIKNNSNKDDTYLNNKLQSINKENKIEINEKKLIISENKQDTKLINSSKNIDKEINSTIENKDNITSYNHNITSNSKRDTNPTIDKKLAEEISISNYINNNKKKVSLEDAYKITNKISNAIPQEHKDLVKNKVETKCKEEINEAIVKSNNNEIKTYLKADDVISTLSKVKNEIPEDKVINTMKELNKESNIEMIIKDSYNNNSKIEDCNINSSNTISSLDQEINKYLNKTKETKEPSNTFIRKKSISSNFNNNNVFTDSSNKLSFKESSTHQSSNNNYNNNFKDNLSDINETRNVNNSFTSSTLNNNPNETMSSNFNNYNNANNNKIPNKELIDIFTKLINYNKSKNSSLEAQYLEFALASLIFGVDENINENYPYFINEKYKELSQYPYEEHSKIQLDRLTAIRILDKLAKKEYIPAMNFIGKLYEYGYNYNQDYKSAIYYYRLTKKQDDLFGIINLSNMYLNGYGIKKDLATAETLFIKAKNDLENKINFNNISSIKQYVNEIFKMGKSYYKGEGIVSNSKEGNKWLNLLIKLNLPFVENYIKIR